MTRSTMRTVLLASALLLASATNAARAQVFPQTAPGASVNGAPGVTQQGIYQTVPVTLDGATLFRIAAPIVPEPGALPLATRASYVQGALAQLVANTRDEHTVYDPQSIKVIVSDRGYQAVLQALDAHHREPLPIVTVTSVDAKYHQVTVQQLAAQWQATLQNALYQALEKRQPAVQLKSATTVLRMGSLLAAVTAVGWFGMLWLKRRIQRLERRLAARESSLVSDRSGANVPQQSAHAKRRRTLALALRVADPQERLTMLHAVRGTLGWALVLAWFAFLTWTFYLFPETTPLARDILQKTIAVAGIWIAAMLANRVFDIAIVRAVHAWLPMDFRMTSEERARQALRAPTTIRAVEGFKSFIVVIIAILATIAQLGVPIAGVVTFGGLAAIGISFAAQNFLRDFLSGFLVIYEDQYAIGDFITINNTYSGIVERLSLRMVQIRDVAGNLITAGHGSVTNVINRSRNWSRVDYRVPVDPACDVERAMEIVRESIERVAKLPAYKGMVLDPVEWIGVDAVSRDWVILRASTKTAPLRQFELRRQINALVVEEFARAGIKFGAPIIDQVQTTQP